MMMAEFLEVASDETYLEKDTLLFTPFEPFAVQRSWSTKPSTERLLSDCWKIVNEKPQQRSTNSYSLPF